MLACTAGRSWDVQPDLGEPMASKVFSENSSALHNRIHPYGLILIHTLAAPYGLMLAHNDLCGLYGIWGGKNIKDEVNC